MASPPGGLVSALQELRAKAITRRIDLVKAFEDSLGSSQERELGIMHKGLFKTVMGSLFGHSSLTLASIDMICETWAAGEPGSPGRYTYVRWRKFATDFDNIPPPPPPNAPSRHFAGAFDSDVFSLSPGKPQRREGRRAHGDLRSASEVHFGGPEDVVPVASVPHGSSEEITRSSIVLQGPDAVSESEIQRNAREAAARNPFAGLRNQSTIGVDVPPPRPPKVPSPAKLKNEKGVLEFTDENTEKPPPGYYYDKDDRLRPYGAYAGATQHSSISDKLSWEHAPDEPINEHKLRGRRVFHDGRATQSIVPSLLTGRNLPPGVYIDDQPHAKPMHPLAHKSTIGSEAMSWNPPDNETSPSRRPLPSWSSPTKQHLAGAFPPPQQQHVQAASEATWRHMDMQGSLRNGGAALPQYSSHYPHASSHLVREEQYNHLQQHIQQQLQQPSSYIAHMPENEPHGRPPLRFSSVAPQPQMQPGQVNLYSTSSSRIGPPTNAPPPPQALYSDAFADRARLSHSFTDHFAAPRGGTGMMH
mmetsp:Transcript_28243/g.77213  ORF Transcript_28243/g.77213 Transcript_28243/m.77213 type:complete len:530 (+) Transcript_28243:59-1648(+)